MSDFIIAYCENYNTRLKTSKHHLVDHLKTNGHRVLYLENGISVLRELVNQKKFYYKNFKPKLKKIEEKIWSYQSVYYFPFHAGIFDVALFNTLNQYLILRGLRKILLDLNFKNPIIINYIPTLLPIIKYLNPKISVLHMVDEWNAMSNVPKSLRKLINKSLISVDLTIVTSQPLYSKYKSNTKKIELIRHGASEKIFKKVATGKLEIHKILKNIKKPIIGYYGALHKLDFDLIKNIAEARSKYNFIFVGPISGSQSLKDIIHLPNNVKIVDSLRHEELPYFIAGLTVFWMPFLKNELTEHMSPIKISEVLMSGTEIITTDLEEIRLMNNQHVYLSNTENEHMENLDRCIKNIYNNRLSISNKTSAYTLNNEMKEILKNIMLIADTKDLK